MNPIIPRIGFHYFPDSAHYRHIDLETWLPELQRLGASSTTLLAPPNRAIPEEFITGLLDAGIEPILHFPFHCRSNPAGLHQDAAGLPVTGCIPNPDPCPSFETLRLLLGAYSRWGVRKAAFFDRPNLRGMWSPSDWLQGDLVERFLDLYLQVARQALDAGITPIFPPLAPGGDYWDLSFLRSALHGLKRRGAGQLLETLILSAEAFIGERPLDWGAGGPERWPDARPYNLRAGEQDHLGFHIFDWYLSISRQELGVALPVILLRAGQRRGGTERGAEFASGVAHAQQNLTLAELLAAPPDQGGLPGEVLAAHYWLLSAAPRSPAASESWFPPAGQVLPVVSAFQAWAARREANPSSLVPASAAEKQELPSSLPDELTPMLAERLSNVAASSVSSEDMQVPLPVEDTGSEEQAEKQEAIDHYILLPLYAWGAADWDLALVQPLVQTGHPTIGFSLTEARLARRVTVVGSPGAVSAEALAMLRKSGCQVERLMEDGTLIASF